MRKSTVRKKICQPDFFSSCRTDLFLELVMSGDFQILPDTTPSLSQLCPGIDSLADCNCQGFLYSPGTIMLPQQSCGPVMSGDCQILLDTTPSLSQLCPGIGSLADCILPGIDNLADCILLVIDSLVNFKLHRIAEEVFRKLFCTKK